MSEWSELAKLTNKWTDEGFDEISKDDIYGLPLTIIDYEEITSDMYGQGVRIFFMTPKLGKKYFSTYSTVITRAFLSNTSKVNELIQSKVAVTFKKMPTSNGKGYYLTLE